jgi:hypothetical protein
MGLSTRPLTLLLGSFLIISGFATPVLANDARAQLEQQQQDPGLITKLSTRLYNALKKATEKIAARITAMDDVDVTILSMERDDRNRMYVELEGEVELKFPNKMVRKLEKYMDDLAGHHVLSDGPLNVDFRVLTVEKTGEHSYHVEFKAKLIIVLEAVLTKLVKFGANVVGTVTLMGIGSDLVAIAEGMDAGLVGDSVGRAMKDMTKVLVGLAGVEAYDAYRGFRADRDSMATGHSSFGSVMAHLGVAVVHGCLRVGTSIAGMTIGAAVGTALFPGAGTTVGALIGAAGLTLAGNIVYGKLTTDLPVWWRLGRIRRMIDRRDASPSDEFKQFLQAKIEKQEIKMLKRFSLEMRTDKFNYLDEILQQVRRRPQYRAAWAGVRAKIEDKLRFEAVNRQDKLFAWKLEQVKEAFDKK